MTKKFNISVCAFGVSIEAEGECTRGHSGSMYAKNGDPGDAPDNGEVVFSSVVATDGDGVIFYDLKAGIKDWVIDFDWLEDEAYKSCFETGSRP